MLLLQCIKNKNGATLQSILIKNVLPFFVYISCADLCVYISCADLRVYSSTVTDYKQTLYSLCLQPRVRVCSHHRGRGLKITDQIACRIHVGKNAPFHMVFLVRMR